ncbi:alpha/beta fold hydrolase [Nocardia farcinica]|uniref:alpha/beta fold hydrolase n=1 Tax=Nocardia farcinica TaxID=37329 RepID=UPI00378CE275
MTVTHPDLALSDRPFGAGTPVTTRTLDIDGVAMTARLAQAREPRAVILALHGGATTSAYFDCPGHPRLSLLRTGPALGYTVLALDRPGYGESHPAAATLTDPQRIVDLIYAATERHLESVPRGAGIFLMAHSAGGPHAVRVAADPRGAEFLGLELAGTGREHQAEAARVLGTHERADPDAVRALLWQPSWLYPPELLGGAPIAAATPRYESSVLRSWPDRDFPELAARVGVPVHYSVGEYENVWRNDDDALTAITGLFSAAPRVHAERLPGSGHNLSLGYSATAYHLRVLTFAEECCLARRGAH